MERRSVYFGNVENAMKFILALGEIDAEVRLISDLKTVNAKSLLGVMTLKMDVPMVLEIIGNEEEREEARLAVIDYITD